MCLHEIHTYSDFHPINFLFEKYITSNICFILWLLTALFEVRLMYTQSIPKKSVYFSSPTFISIQPTTYCFFLSLSSMYPMMFSWFFGTWNMFSIVAFLLLSFFCFFSSFYIKSVMHAWDSHESNMLNLNLPTFPNIYPRDDTLCRVWMYAWMWQVVIPKPGCFSKGESLVK